MNPLKQLYDQEKQSPWLDNLKRSWLLDGELERWVGRGIRGLTSNPTIFANAIMGSTNYDDEFFAALEAGATIEDAYWQLVVSDIRGALELLRPTYEASKGEDGFVSIEVNPKLALDADETTQAARSLHQLIKAPNLYVKIPGTRPGLTSIREMTSERRSINVTLIFSVQRYREVAEAYISGLEAASGDLSQVSSVASFFLSRVDTETDKRLIQISSPEAEALKGKTAVASAKLAYQAFQQIYSTPRWEELEARGANKQRLLWASTSTKSPSYPDTLYVDSLIGPNTVNTMPDDTIKAFEEHGTIARTIDQNTRQAAITFTQLQEVGIHLDDVTDQLEAEGIVAFEKSFDALLEALASKAAKKGFNFEPNLESSIENIESSMESNSEAKELEAAKELEKLEA